MQGGRGGAIGRLGPAKPPRVRQQLCRGERAAMGEIGEQNLVPGIAHQGGGVLEAGRAILAGFDQVIQDCSRTYV